MSAWKPTIPQAFASRKAAIVSSLSIPEEHYTDLSPKGTVDEAIVPLIRRINKLDGVVTTSSCAGRVSVFLEGCKNSTDQTGADGLQESRSDVVDRTAQNSVPGGKGMGGRWLFVSHEPVPASAIGPPATIKEVLGLSRADLDAESTSPDIKSTDVRLVRFQFEPMILHIMCASLHHATGIVAAAINAGFRESGVQSLKNLTDPNAFPMVAIRTSGLSLESLIGYVDDTKNPDSRDDTIHTLVSDQYLRLLLSIANGRFDANKERMQRFERALFHRDTKEAVPWEAAAERGARKRAEGLARQEQIRNSKQHEEAENAGDDDTVAGLSSLPLLH